MDREMTIIQEIKKYLMDKYEVQYNGKMKLTIDDYPTGNPNNVLFSYSLPIPLSNDLMPLNIGGCFDTDTKFIDYICKEIDKRHIYNYKLFRAVNYGKKYK